MEKTFQEQYDAFQFEKGEQPPLDQLLVTTLIKSDEMEEEIYSLEYQKRKRLFWKRLSEYVSLPKKDIELYETQIHWLNQKIGTMSLHQEYFHQIMEISNTENAEELLKLLHFTYRHCREKIGDKEEKVEETLEFENFFQDKIQSLRIEEVVEKNKVIW